MPHRRARPVSSGTRSGHQARVLLGGLLLVLALAASPGAAPAASTLPALNVAIGKTTVSVSGSTVSGAVNVVSTAEKGLKEPLTLIFQLKPGVTVDELNAFLNSAKGQDPNNFNRYGSIVFDAEDIAGKTTEAQTVLEPGNYVAVNAEGNPGKAAQAAFTVTAAPTPAALPAPGGTIKTIEFGFKGPKVIKVGEVVRFENEGFLVHMDIAFPVKNKKNGEKLIKILRSGNERKAEKLVSGPPIGFAGPMSSGAFQQETISAKPGLYVQVCFMETQDKRPHTKLGMERLIKVTK